MQSYTFELPPASAREQAAGTDKTERTRESERAKLRIVCLLSIIVHPRARRGEIGSGMLACAVE